MLEKLKQYFKSYMYTPEQLANIKDSLMKRNHRVWQIVSIVALLYLGAQFIATFSVEIVQVNRIVYGELSLAFGISAVLLSTIVKPGHRLLMPLIYLLSLLLLTFGVLIGPVLNPTDMAVTFFPMLIVLPLLVIAKPWHLSLISLLSVIGFCVAAALNQTGRPLDMNMYNALSFGILGQFLIFYMSKVNIRPYVLQLEAHNASITDQLTGLYNRMAYEQDVREMEADHKDMVYMAMDANDLKITNDTMGHEAGDELLCGTAACIRECFGAMGRCYRIGGDEFVVLMRADEPAFEKARNHFQSVLENWHGHQVKHLSISIGYVTAKDMPTATMHELSVAADRKMYEDKEKYRKRMKKSSI